MAKIDDEVLASVLVEEKMCDQSEVWTFIDKVKKAEADAKEPKEESERLPVEYVIVTEDPDFSLPESITGWIIQKKPDSTATPSEIDTETDINGQKKYSCGWGDLEVSSKLEKWGQSMKSSPRFKAHMFKCLGDYFEYGTKSKAEEVGLKIKTKVPVSIISVKPRMPYFEEPGVEITEEINSLN